MRIEHGTLRIINLATVVPGITYLSEYQIFYGFIGHQARHCSLPLLLISFSFE